MRKDRQTNRQDRKTDMTDKETDRRTDRLAGEFRASLKGQFLT